MVFSARQRATKFTKDLKVSGYVADDRNALAARAASVVLALAALGAIVPADARAATCARQVVGGVEIVDLSDEFDCDRGADLASRAVLDDGFLQEGGFYCRWGQGGTRPTQRNGKTFYAGFCTEIDTEAEITFLARPPLEACDDDRSDGDDLRARFVDCKTAQRVYKRSLAVASRSPGKLPLRFRYAGEKWTCRAYNPHHRNRNPAWYEWKCRAAHDVLVHFRWFPGD